MMPRVIKSVSYTHLRAHETEADLVCRLLLEKKYKKNVKIYRGGISASSIIKISEVVFSLPFSSPSLLAKRMKVKSYYYDPFNFIKHTKYNNKSVKIIKTVNELKKVLKGI